MLFKDDDDDDDAMKVVAIRVVMVVEFLIFYVSVAMAKYQNKYSSSAARLLVFINAAPSRGNSIKKFLRLHLCCHTYTYIGTKYLLYIKVNSTVFWTVHEPEALVYLCIPKLIIHNTRCTYACCANIFPH